MRKVVASSAVGIAQVNDSVIRLTVMPSEDNCARVPPGHGSWIGSATGVPATSLHRR